MNKNLLIAGALAMAFSLPFSAAADETVTVSPSKTNVKRYEPNSTSWSDVNPPSGFFAYIETDSKPSVRLTCENDNSGQAYINNIGVDSDTKWFDFYTAKSPLLAVYYITAPEGYVITGINAVLKTAGAGNPIVWKIGEKSFTSSAAGTAVELEFNDREIKMVPTADGTNVVPTEWTDFTITIAAGEGNGDSDKEEDGDRFTVFDNYSSIVPYRIPAIGKNMDGDIIAVADYRYSGKDIGMATNGKLDLRFRIKDATTGKWGDVQTLKAAFGEGSSNVAFGDPCIVGDRESNRMLVTSCCGNVSFPSGTHANHMGWARFYSEDGGKTWSDYEDISDQVFSQLDKRSNGQIQSFFIGSGKISQSRKIKQGDYYRLYLAALVKDKAGTYINYVFFSDDFGMNWHLLGDVNDCPVPDGADEPKADELPDGSVLISTRIAGGRYFNVFHYTDIAKGEGSWGKRAKSNSSVNGITASASACNGEIMVLPVVRNSDNEKMHILLQSVPFGPSDRSNVGVNYKVLENSNDYADAAALAKDWDGKLQVSFTTSGYSTMCLDNDGDIAFFMEENYRANGYDMVYCKLTMEQITNGEYSVDTKALEDNAGIENIIDKNQGINSIDKNLPAEVFDIAGRKISQRLMMEELHTLPAGLYILRQKNAVAKINIK